MYQHNYNLAKARKVLPHVGHTWGDSSVVMLAALVLRWSRFLCTSTDLFASDVQEPLVIRARARKGDPGFPSKRQCQRT